MMSIALPQADEIHVWLVDENQVCASLDVLRYLRVLSVEEYARHERLQVATHRRQFLITRAAVRAMFSQYVPEVLPSQWAFTHTPRGRPVLDFPPLHNKVSFNISHARGLLAIAVSAGGALGVDVEWHERHCAVLALAKRYFSPVEVEALCALPIDCQRQRFFDLWTLKEAYVKARGIGLGIALHSFAFEFDQQGIGIKLNQANDLACARHWQFWQSRMSPAHTLALAYSGPNDKNSECVRQLQAYRFIPLGHEKPQEMELAPANYFAL